MDGCLWCAAAELDGNNVGGNGASPPSDDGQDGDSDGDNEEDLETDALRLNDVYESLVQMDSATAEARASKILDGLGGNAASCSHAALLTTGFADRCWFASTRLSQKHVHALSINFASLAVFSSSPSVTLSEPNVQSCFYRLCILFVAPSASNPDC